MERRKMANDDLGNFSIWIGWGAIEDTDILTAFCFNQSFFKKKIPPHDSSCRGVLIKYGLPVSSEKLPD